MTVHDRIEQLAVLVANQAKLRNGVALQSQKYPHQAKALGDQLDAISREWHIRMVGHYKRRYPGTFNAIIHQALREHGSLERLPDSGLVELVDRLAKAVECMKWGIPFEDADVYEIS